MRHNCKASESDPRGVLGHGGETYNDKTFRGPVRQTWGLVDEMGPEALESINGRVIQSKIPHKPRRNGGVTTSATLAFRRCRERLIELQRGDGA